MWYEIIPSFAIICVGMAIPSYAVWGLHKLFTNNGYRRNFELRRDRALFCRDAELSGDGYKCLGLENIPDEDPLQQSA